MMIRITSRENPVVKAVAKLVKSREERREKGLFVCEGEVMLKEAVSGGADIKEVFIRKGKSLDSGLIPQSAAVYEVEDHVLEKISDVKTTRDVIFTCAMPKGGSLFGERVIVLENVSDPGNVGTIVRTSEAFGMDSVVFLGSCADLYSPKTIRATMGSVFRVNAVFMEEDEFFLKAQAMGLTVFAAALSPGAQEIYSVDLGKAAVMIGNEANGLSKNALDKCDKHVIIPISGIQSLNAAVAASVFMYEMAACRRRQVKV